MRFALNEEQIEFGEAVRSLLSDACGPDQIRASWSDSVTAGGGPGGGNGRIETAWRALAEMGVLGLMVPEQFGGLGMTDEDLSPLLVEAGRAGLPDPVSETAGVATGAIASMADAGVDEPRISEILSGIAAGEISAGVMFAPRSETPDSTKSSNREIALSELVPAASSLDLLMVFAGDSLYLVDRAAIVGEAVDSVDGSRCLLKVSAPLDGTAVDVPGDRAIELERVAFNRAALGAAAQLLGLSRRMLDMTVEYAAERRQFGVPIGSFQAVKHRLADAALAVEFVEPLIMRAAHSMAHESPNASIHVSMAKAKASAAAVSAGKASLQVHGAIGYTVECDLHLYLKRSWALARQYGDEEFHRRRVRAGLNLAHFG